MTEPQTNLGETTRERELIQEIYTTQQKLVEHVSCIKDHLDKGDYTNVVYHLAIIQLVALAVGEEVVRVLVSDTEMAELVSHSADGLAGMVAVLLRDLQQMKEDGE